MESKECVRLSVTKTCALVSRAIAKPGRAACPHAAAAGWEQSALPNSRGFAIVSSICVGAVACFVIVASLFFVCGCDATSIRGEGSFGAQIGLVPPPVSVTFRVSLLKGYVLQLHNRSGNRVVATVYVENKELNQSKNISVSIAPNEMEELGLLEMDWAFIPGENGRVSVDGFAQAISFEIYNNGKYKVW